MLLQEQVFVLCFAFGYVTSAEWIHVFYFPMFFRVASLAPGQWYAFIPAESKDDNRLRIFETFY